MTTYADQLSELQEQGILGSDSEAAAFNKLLGYNVATAREKKGWMQKQLADAMGVSQATWSRRESGESPLSAYDLALCAKVLGRRIQDLIPT